MLESIKEKRFEITSLSIMKNLEGMNYNWKSRYSSLQIKERKKKVSLGLITVTRR